MITLQAKAMQNYSHNKLHRVETTNVLPSKSFHVHGVFFKYRDNYYVDEVHICILTLNMYVCDL